MSANHVLVIGDRASSSARRSVSDSISSTHRLVDIALEVTVAGEKTGGIDWVHWFLYYEPNDKTNSNDI